MAKGKWKVFGQMIGSEKQYIIGRQLDESKPLHSGNVEYYDGYSENRVAQQIRADHLNEMEAYEAAHPVDRRVGYVESGK